MESVPTIGAPTPGTVICIVSELIVTVPTGAAATDPSDGKSYGFSGSAPATAPHPATPSATHSLFISVLQASAPAYRKTPHSQNQIQLKPDSGPSPAADNRPTSASIAIFAGGLQNPIIRAQTIPQAGRPDPRDGRDMQRR